METLILNVTLTHPKHPPIPLIFPLLLSQQELTHLTHYLIQDEITGRLIQALAQQGYAGWEIATDYTATLPNQTTYRYYVIDPLQIN